MEHSSTTSATEPETLKRTAFHDIHAGLGAKIVPFAGYEMPVLYKGIVAEHNAVREKVGVFDVSHMGEVLVKGPRALDFIQSITVNDASTLVDGQAQYSAMCRREGGIIDDLLVYRIGEGDYMLVVNASTTPKDLAWMEENMIDGVELKNVSDEFSLLAVQGPRSLETMQKLTDSDLASLEYYHFLRGKIAGVDAIISRTGYTGEIGLEIYFPGDRETGEKVWNAIMEAGAEFGIEPAGLGARDTLRLEMGYCLYGNDIDETTNPIEAGLGWITKLAKESFNAKDVLQKEKDEKPKRKLVGFEMQERAIPRQHYRIFAEGRDVGEVTSGTQSPSLGRGIGMGYVDAAFSKPGTPIAIMIREKEVPAVVARPPFYKKQG